MVVLRHADRGQDGCVACLVKRSHLAFVLMEKDHALLRGGLNLGGLLTDDAVYSVSPALTLLQTQSRRLRLLLVAIRWGNMVRL